MISLNDENGAFRDFGTEMICYCSSVDKGRILRAIAGGAKTLKDIREATGACTVGRCATMNPKGR